jgi:hypothetical protein
MDIRTIEAKRRAVLNQMLELRSMRPGSVSEQYMAKKGKGAKRGERSGPYYVWCRYVDGRYLSQRLRSPEEVAQAYVDVDNRKRFETLCNEFEELTERLGELERQRAASNEAVKKGLKPRRNAPRK